MPTLQLPKDRDHAPEFPSDFSWVNTDRPLFIKKELKGRVVVLDFWTYCCINCMHVLPDLEFIEQKYASEPVVVVGVHSAKFDNESDAQNIRTACQRYHIAHPVIVDENHRVWSEYAVRAWPTLIVIDPEGRVVGSLSGEGNREVLDAVVHSLLAEGRAKGTLASGPPEFNRQARVPSPSGLAFPGKVLVSSNSDLLFITDSNHNRIVVADSSGNVNAIAGSGSRGNQDGSFAEAEFNNPQGLAFDEARNILYVADTDNHLIRKLDLQKRMVETISGTGIQVYDRAGGNAGRKQGLNSPWDLALVDNRLFIAMAGPHQLWVLDLNTQIAKVWSGSGREDIVDGPATASALAQPSGIARKGDWLYFVDSEVSALRRASIKNGSVESLIGSGLFDFGDRDGAFGTALLQHPLGIAVHGDDILVADTYNHKIKRAIESAKRISTIAGNGKPDAIPSDDGELSLYEPGGISVSGDWLYIADTNHDRIVRYNLVDGRWSEVTLRNLRTIQTRSMETSTLPVREVEIGKREEIELSLNADFPSGIHLNREAPIHYVIMSPSGKGSIEGSAPAGRLPVTVKARSSELNAGGELTAVLSIAYCTDGNSGLCVPVDLAWRLKLRETPGGPTKITLSETVKAISQ